MSDSPKALAPSRDEIIKDAKDFPQWVALAQQFDPQLAARLMPSSPLGASSFWGQFAGGVIAWAVAKWGLGWTPDFQAGLAAAVASGCCALGHLWDHRALSAAEPRAMGDAGNALMPKAKP